MSRVLFTTKIMAVTTDLGPVNMSFQHKVQHIIVVQSFLSC